jgi:hypothetical protein
MNTANEIRAVEQVYPWPVPRFWRNRRPRDGVSGLVKVRLGSQSLSEWASPWAKLSCEQTHPRIGILIRIGM